MRKFHCTLFTHTWKVILCIVLAIGLMNLVLPARPIYSNISSATTQPTTGFTAGASMADDNEKKREAESKAAFAEAYTVFMHPRCMNCHPSGDVPLQGDDSHLHTQGVKRGPDGKGLYALKCSNCHQSADLEGEHLPPGHPNWHLPTAARPMVFQGKSPRQLAMSFKDPKFTGFTSIDQLIEHVEHDKLVLHSFTYGTRPPLTHEDFVAKVKEWVEKGAALPDK